MENEEESEALQIENELAKCKVELNMKNSQILRLKNELNMVRSALEEERSKTVQLYVDSSSKSQQSMDLFSQLNMQNNHIQKQLQTYEEQSKNLKENLSNQSYQINVLELEKKALEQKNQELEEKIIQLQMEVQHSDFVKNQLINEITDLKKAAQISEKQHQKSFDLLQEKYNLDVSHLQFELLNKTETPPIHIQLNSGNTSVEKFSEILSMNEKLSSENRDLKLENCRLEQHCKLLLKKLRNQSIAIKRLVEKLNYWDKFTQEQKIAPQENTSNIIQLMQQQICNRDAQIQQIHKQYHTNFKLLEDKYNSLQKQKNEYELFVSLQDEISKFFVNTLKNIKENPQLLQSYPLRGDCVGSDISTLSLDESIALINYFISHLPSLLPKPLKQNENINSTLANQNSSHPTIVTPRSYFSKSKLSNQHFLPRI